MGDEILMKKLLIPFMCTTFLFANAPDPEEKMGTLVQDIKMMFDKIGERRVGIDESKINTLATPFLEVGSKNQPIAQESEQIPVLQAILNKKVKVNGKWYGLYEKIGDFEIVSITSGSILLKNNEEKLTLSIRKKNENIKLR